MISARSYLPLILAVAAIAACSDDSSPTRSQPTSQSVDVDTLVGAWTHSYEEQSDAPGAELYRPTGSREFEPSWFRMQYDLRADGSCAYLWLAPNDAHELRPGTWAFDPDDDRVVLLRDEEGRVLPHLSFRVIELRDDLLRIASGIDVTD